MRPWKYSPQRLLPPIRNAPVDVTIGPATARVPTCVPFTNSRSVVLSNVTARCVHVFSGSAAVPRASNGVSVCAARTTYTTGRSCPRSSTG